MAILHEPPRLACCFAPNPGPLAADADSALWRGIDAVFLVDVVSGAKPLQSTGVKIAWSDEAMRVLLCAQDTHAWATLTERDEPLDTEEVVGVFLDPVGDLAGYSEIEVNPLNAVLDLYVRRTRMGYRKDSAWNCEGLGTCVRRGDGSVTTELSIPFDALGRAPQPGSAWRANFTRVDRPPGRERELSAWAPAGRRNFHTPERFGFIDFCR